MPTTRPTPKRNLIQNIFFLFFVLLSGCQDASEKRLAQAESAYEHKEYDRAISISESFLTSNPKSLPAHRLIAFSYIDQEKVSEALSDYRSIETTDSFLATLLLKEIALHIIQRSLTHENYFARSAAVKAIGEMGEVKQIPLIVPSLKDSETFVRFFSAEALGHLGGAKALQLLMGAGRDPEPMVRVAVLKAIDEMTQQDKGELVGLNEHRLFESFKKDPEQTVQLFALAAMAKRGDGAAFSEMRQIFERLKGGSDPSLWVALGRTKNKTAIPLLVEGLKRTEAPIRMYATEAIGEIADPATYDLLSKMLSDSDPAVRGAAATSLGKLGDKRAIRLLIPALQETDAIARVSVAEGLKRLGQSEESVYREAMNHEDYGVRHFAIGSLIKNFGKEGLPILEAALSDNAPRVRIAAVRGIGEIGDQTGIPLLTTALKDTDVAVRTYAAGNLVRLMDKNQTQTSQTE